MSAPGKAGAPAGGSPAQATLSPAERDVHVPVVGPDREKALPDGNYRAGRYTKENLATLTVSTQIAARGQEPREGFSRVSTGPKGSLGEIPCWPADATSDIENAAVLRN